MKRANSSSLPGWLNQTSPQFAYSTFFTVAPIPKVNGGNEITEPIQLPKSQKLCHQRAKVKGNEPKVLSYLFRILNELFAQN